MRRNDRDRDVAIGKAGAKGVDTGDYAVDDGPVAFREECDFCRL
jgi:hypothetical protein